MRQLLQKLHHGMVRFTYRSGEPTDERHRKNVFVPILFLAVLIMLLNVDDSFVRRGMWGVTVAGFTALLLYPFITKRMPRGFTDVVVVYSMATLISSDFVDYGIFEQWLWVVVIMDILLLMGGRDAAYHIVRIVASAYIVFISINGIWDIGVYENLPSLTHLDPPPKKDPQVGFYLLTTRLSVLLIDAAITRYFSKNMKKEQARITSYLKMAERVSDALVCFDLARAEQVLDEADTADDDTTLHDTFCKLLENLRIYRPYLPDALFIQEDMCELSIDEMMESSPEPSSPRKTTLVFTDIVSSSGVWEAVPGGMKKAMLVHDRVVRSCIVQHRGYEVKTIGDAFMVAFKSTYDACSFGLAVQQGLYEAKWPEELQGVPQCERVDGTWNGLRVRIGVHTGEVAMQMNPVTGRADFFGPVVNIAARVEGTAFGGTVAVTEAVMQDILKDVEGAQLITTTARHVLEDVELRGVRGRFTITLLVPSSLSHRLKSNSISYTVPVPTTISTVPAESWGSRVGTAGQFKVDWQVLRDSGDPASVVNQALGAALDCIDRTDGIVATVLSNGVTATWNIRKKVIQHARQAMLGATRLISNHSSYSVGVATGDIFYGKAGSSTRRFVMAIGLCMDLADQLAVTAAQIGANILTAAAPGYSCVIDDPSFTQPSRQIDTWEFPAGSVAVYQVRVFHRLHDFGYTDSGLEWGWSEDFEKALQERNLTAIHERGEGDTVLMNLVEAKGAPLMPRVSWTPSPIVEPHGGDLTLSDQNISAVTSL